MSGRFQRFVVCYKYPTLLDRILEVDVVVCAFGEHVNRADDVPPALTKSFDESSLDVLVTV